jgi:hypothetical protein
MIVPNRRKKDFTMKALFQKPWFIGLLTIGSLLLVFFLNLWIMSLKLPLPYEENFWVLAEALDTGEFVNVFAFIFTILFYVSIIPILYAGIAIIKKNNKGFVVAIIFFFAFETLLIVFHSIFKFLSTFAMILVIVNVVFLIGSLVLLILRAKTLNLTIDHKKAEKEVRLSLSKIPLAVLIVDAIAVLIVILTFILPLFTVVISDSTYPVVLANVLFLGETKIEIVIFFLVNFALLLGLILYLAGCVSYYFYDKESFIKKSKTLMSFVFIITLIYFLTGLTMVIYHTFIGNSAETISYVPMLLISADIFLFSIFLGKFHAMNHTVIPQNKVKFPRIESLFYIVLLSAITGLMLLLRVIIIQIRSGSYTDTISLTGIEILRDYASLDPGYRIIAFALVVMIISCSIFLVAAIAGYLSKYRHFDSIVKSAAAVNIFFVFMISISGYYFQIGQRIDFAVIMDIFEFYGIPVPGNLTDYTYVITSEAIYALIASVAVLVIMFIRKAFDRDELNLMEALVSPSTDVSAGDAASKSLNNGDEDDSPNNFDPCPAFTELDQKTDEFHQELERRKSLKTQNTTLNELVQFVVEYARNSRLHLSYTEEDIATFIAGLGASKLSILQGMSGTGKTSLPKIFSEAILANGEIVEVESSWKDKNELLGYYNEFSMKYTPKKFTLSLYKTALNKDFFTFILLDEMNLSRIEYYFSDFLSLMEHEEDKRELKLINIKLSRIAEKKEIDYLGLEQGHTLRIPPNVWFIGTANRDESTFVISDKVYDRAQTMNFTKRAAKVRNYSNPIPQQYYDYETMNRLLLDAKQNGKFDAENNPLVKSVEALLTPFNISFGNRILKQIEDFVNIYCACFANDDVENEAIEKILLSKVVAKLEVKTIDDKEKLEMEFEKLNFHQCVEFIKRLDGD